MGAVQNVIGIVRGINDRKQYHQIDEAAKNYLTDPEAAIKAVNDIDSMKGIQFNQNYQAEQASQRAEQAKALETADATQTRTRERTLKALTTMSGMMANARDTPGGDLGGTYDRLVPVFKNGLGMGDEEISYWKQQIEADPSIIDSIGQTAKQEMRTMTPGSALVNDKGEELYRNPVTPKVINVGRGDGGHDIVTIDPQTGAVVNSGGGRGSPGSGPAPYNGPKSINGQAKGMRNNNPGNLEASPWTQGQPGFVKSDGRFGKFQSMEQGVAALDKLVGNKFRQGMNTPAKLIQSWAPASENGASTGNYAAYVAGRLGIGVNDPIPPNSLPTARQAIIEFENGGAAKGGGSAQGPGASYSTPGKPAAPGYRLLTPQEKQQNGLPEDTQYQVSPKGQISPVGGTAPRRTKTNSGNVTPEQLEAKKYGAAGKMDELINAGEALLHHKSFDAATGPVDGLLPSVFPGSRDFDDRMQSFRDVIALEAIATLKSLSSTGATGFGNMTEKEGSRIENSRGSLRQTSPKALRETLGIVLQSAKVARAYIRTDARIPREALELLIKRPGTAKQFDQQFGQGTSRLVLGK